MRRLALFLLCALGAVTPARAGVLYSQPPFSRFLSGSLSQADAFGGADNARAYDDFVLAGGGQVGYVEWEGWYLNPPGSAAGFTVAFWSNAAGNQPGTLLLAETFRGGAGETPDPLLPGLFSYHVDLTVPFDAAAGVRYWLSVQADAGTRGNWFWQAGTGGNSREAQDVNGQRSFFNADEAFTLGGTETAAVPEPSSFLLGLVGAGLAGGAWLRRRRAGSAATA